MGRTMDANWITWVKENIDRGCSPEEIKSILKREGFDNKAIARVIKNTQTAQTRIHPNEPDEAVSTEALEAEAMKSAFVDRLDHTEASNDSTLYKKLSQVRITQPYIHPDIKKIENPKIQLYTWDDFLSSAECTALLKIINAQLRPSTITVSNGDNKFRTSSTSDLSCSTKPFVREIDEKISKALGIYRSYSEGIQAQRYDVGQEFKAHTDYFEPNTDEFQQFAAQQGQRTWTFMIYLKNTEAGGGTKFVNLDKIFYPKAGQAVIWNNLTDTGSPNADTLHHGMPVLKGSKVIITKWFRDKGEEEMFYASAQNAKPPREKPKKRFKIF